MYDKNLSARQVSIMTGLSKSTLNRIVNGQVSPPSHTVEQLAKGLHLKVTGLFESDIQ
ncbi:helix-turn-helix domain-containing protein [Dorea formicigenerans]|uniref:helix-turn-helix domain-containing protein n=1 Tax=Dorea formicigenerans TaxID=39486 RepID=UPI0022E19E63|nr:helix-turn-helix transcriptional regulator [Dorea formicigenerans]